jgi:hypothetical protein
MSKRTNSNKERRDSVRASRKGRRDSTRKNAMDRIVSMTFPPISERMINVTAVKDDAEFKKLAEEVLGGDSNYKLVSEIDQQAAEASRKVRNMELTVDDLMLRPAAPNVAADPALLLKINSLIYPAMNEYVSDIGDATLGSSVQMVRETLRLALKQLDAICPEVTDAE